MGKTFYPIEERQHDILSAVSKNQVVIIDGTAGCGKTTQIPQFLLKGNYGKEKWVGVTEPRRLAATSAAYWVAEELCVPLGGLVGFRTRYEAKLKQKNGIKYMTDGILKQEVFDDPLFEQYQVIILDEVHERNKNLYGLMAYLQKDVLPNRKDLKLVLMSATGNSQELSSYFHAPIIRVKEEMYPVEVEYREGIIDFVEAAIKEVFAIHSGQLPGDILIFMPGENEIYDVIEGIQELSLKNVVALPLFSALPRSEQKAVFEKVDGRKIIVATKIARTSITIDGIVHVIDSGLENIRYYNCCSDFSSLEAVKISKDAAEQQARRAGRTQHGRCIRLFSQRDFSSRAEYTLPEVDISDVSDLSLWFRSLGRNIRKYKFISPIPKERLQAAEKKVVDLGILTKSNYFTDLGHQIARIPLDFELALAVVRSQRYGCVKQVSTIAAMLSIPNIFSRETSREKNETDILEELRDKYSDFTTLFNVWSAYEKSDFSEAWAIKHSLNVQALETARSLRNQVLSAVYDLSISLSRDVDTEDINKAFLDAFSHKVCFFSGNHSYYCGDQQSIYIHPGSAVFGQDYEMIVSYEFLTTSRTFARNNAVVKYEWLKEMGIVLPRKKQQTFPIEMPLISITGKLEVKTDSGEQKLVELDIDLARPNATELAVIRDDSILINEEQLPLCNLGFSLKTLEEFSKKGITTLFQLPTITGALKDFNLSNSAITETLRVLRRIGYAPEGTELTDPGIMNSQALTDQSATEVDEEDLAADRLLQEFLQKPVEELELPNWGIFNPTHVLVENGIKIIGDVVAKTSSQLLELPNFGVTSLDVLEERLSYFGLSLTREEKKKSSHREKWLAFGDKLANFIQLDSEQVEKVKDALGEAFFLFEQVRHGATWQERLIARNELTLRNMGLCEKVAHGFSDVIKDNAILDHEDLVQEGAIGLMRSIEDYDYAVGSFSTYAWWWIKQSIMRYIGEFGAAFHVPVHVWEKITKLSYVLEALTHKLGYQPSQEEIAEEMGNSIEEFEKLRGTILRIVSIISLDAPYGDSSDDSDISLYESVITEDDVPNNTIDEIPNLNSRRPDSSVERDELLQIVGRILQQAPLLPIERYCLEKYFWEKRTYDEIGILLGGITRERVRQRIEDALTKFRTVEVWDKTHDFMSGLLHPSQIVPDEKWRKGFDCIETAFSEEKDYSPEDIILLVSSFFGISFERLIAPEDQTAEEKVATKVVVYLLSRLCKLESSAIAIMLGCPEKTMFGFYKHVETKMEKWGRLDLWRVVSGIRREPILQEKVEIDWVQSIRHLARLLDNFSVNDHWTPADIVARAASFIEASPELFCEEEFSCELVSCRVACAYFLATKLSFKQVDEILHFKVGSVGNTITEFEKQLIKAGRPDLLVVAFASFPKNENEAWTFSRLEAIYGRIGLDPLELLCAVRKLGLNGRKPMHSGLISQAFGIPRAEVEDHYNRAIEKLWNSPYWQELCQIAPSLSEAQ